MKSLKVAILGVALLCVGGGSSLFAHFSFNLGLFPFFAPPCAPVYMAPPPPCYYYCPRPVVVHRHYCPCCPPCCHSHSQVIIQQYSNCPCQ